MDALLGGPLNWLYDREVKAYIALDSECIDGPHVVWRLFKALDYWRSENSWDSGSFFLWGAIFGGAFHREESIERRDAVVRLPEGDYPVKVHLYESVWTMPRWPGEWHRCRRVNIECRQGIDDLGPKGPTYGLTFSAASIDEAVAEFTADILKRRGGEEFKVITPVRRIWAEVLQPSVGGPLWEQRDGLTGRWHAWLNNEAAVSALNADEHVGLYSIHEHPCGCCYAQYGCPCVSTPGETEPCPNAGLRPGKGIDASDDE